MEKKRVAAERTRRKIMDAVEKLIAERGFDNVTVDEITAEAGVSKGSFYTYFKRKEDVVGEIAHEHFYEALNWTPSGKTAVKLSAGEPPNSNYLRAD